MTPTPREPIGRPPEIEDPSNRWLVHRISRALLPLAMRTGVHPNVVSLAGLGSGAGAAWLYRDWPNTRAATAGLLLMIAWHVFDGLDGQLARATGRTSAVGRFLDGVCDYATFILVYVALAASLGPEHGWAESFALAMAAGAAHAAQAAWYEGERERFRALSCSAGAGWPSKGAGGTLERGYDRLQRMLGAGRHDLAPLVQGEGRRIYASAAAPVVRKMSLVGANGRSFGIWLACIAGDPRLFWLWELVGLTAVCLILARRIASVEERLVDDLSSAERGC
jgi:phosphatidylglycerophosphate synthase